MGLWLVVFSLGMILIVKWYTSREIQRLYRKAHGLRQDRRMASDKLRTVTRRRAKVEEEVERMKFKVQRIKNIIDDLNTRLEGAEDGSEGRLGTSSPVDGAVEA